ncbi:alpha/beta fold hydrolase [Spirilliplanes yamanashiensis]|uniref:Alpha/beta hydrolase n=1 Tax=Spirilliplanes yamanashiensis TaxID=42233 RepID=A0A8J3Y425_9ACTN|nr:alpha/beta fold hydrolase [Spirilliplanes yamanashiensis]MDP9819976.1 pimeloyl-ACP methyl ester carboxylesterase [Spirilliplanes yamanashiensis]GIJ01205.1 alpha/beta hydrolase [Spirilliplanes yamanashiensis]
MPLADLPAGPLRYADTGTGAPVVFLHGAFQDGRVWAPLVDRLAPAFRCVVPDLPLGGHRQPMRAAADRSAAGVADVVADFVEHLGAGPVTLVGNDTGTAVAQLVAARRPDLLERLVLTSGEAFENCPPAVFRGLPPAARLGVLPAVLAPLRLRPLRRLPMGFGLLTRGPLPHDLIGSWLAAYFGDREVRRDAAGFLASLADRRLLVDRSDDLRRFDRPVLVLWGADDRLFPPAHAHRLGALFPAARVELVAGSRTWVMRDRPDRTADLVRDFIAPG